tara:strand:- start:20779 stop:21171 length:393 start_codon:yes stop_codon:yes gene_type:complete
MQLNKRVLEALRDDINKALRDADIDVRYGIELKTGKCSFNANNATMKLEIAAVGDDGQVESKEAIAWKSRAELMGLPTDGIGKKFSWNGCEYTVTGLNTKARKYPVCASLQGKTYRFPVSVVVGALRASA